MQVVFAIVTGFLALFALAGGFINFYNRHLSQLPKTREKNMVVGISAVSVVFLALMAGLITWQWWAFGVLVCMVFAAMATVIILNVVRLYFFHQKQKKRCARFFREKKQIRDNLQILDLEVPVPDLADSLEGFRILHLTDIHYNGENGEPIRIALEEATRLEPDLILITGDFVWGAENADGVGDLLKTPEARYGIYAVRATTTTGAMRTRWPPRWRMRASGFWPTRASPSRNRGCRCASRVSSTPIRTFNPPMRPPVWAET